MLVGSTESFLWIDFVTIENRRTQLMASAASILAERPITRWPTRATRYDICAFARPDGSLFSPARQWEWQALWLGR